MKLRPRWTVSANQGKKLILICWHDSGSSAKKEDDAFRKAFKSSSIILSRRSGTTLGKIIQLIWKVFRPNQVQEQ